MKERMNPWRWINFPWKEEEVQKWPSLKKTAYLLLPLLIYFVVHDIAEILFSVFLEMLVRGGSERTVTFLDQYWSTVRSVLYGIASLAGAGVLWTGVKGEIIPDVGKEEIRAESEPDIQGKKWTDVKRFTAYWGLAMLAFCVAAGLNMIFTQIGFTGSSESYQTVYRMQYGVTFGAGLVLYGIISPIAEEAVFRGLLYNRMKRCFHYGIALVVSSLLFGIYHGNLVQAVYGSILGILIAYFYDQYKSFAAPVLFHGVANISVYVMTYGSEPAQAGDKIALITGTIFLAAAVLLFFYLKKKCLPEINTG